MTKSNSNNESKSSNNSNDLLVAILDQTVMAAAPGGGKEIYRPVCLTCPKSGQERDYLLLTTSGTGHSSLLELQRLPAPTSCTSNKAYSSWFVGNHVIGGGGAQGAPLHVMTRVDPLWFILPHMNLDDKNKQQQQQQWQPLEQLLTIPEAIHTCLMLDQGQLAHVCDSYEIDEEECFYKFSKPKTLNWLQKKQEAAQHVLLQQTLAERERMLLHNNNNNTSGGGVGSGGAFASGFRLSSAATTSSSSSSETNSSTSCNENKENKEHNTGTSTKTEPTPEQLQHAKHESIQIVCNYLNPDWQTEFLAHLKIGKAKAFQEEDEGEKTTKKSKTTTPYTNSSSSSMPIEYYTTGASAAVTPGVDGSKQAPPPPKLSFGQKQLQKVNKKGMKSMTSFFAVKKKN